MWSHRFESGNLFDNSLVLVLLVLKVGRGFESFFLFFLLVDTFLDSVENLVEGSPVKREFVGRCLGQKSRKCKDSSFSMIVGELGREKKRVEKRKKR